MGISINIALQLAYIAPLVKGCAGGIMLGRQKMHFNPPGWTERLIKKLQRLGIEAAPEDLFQEDGFCETYLKTIGWPKLESLDFSAIEGAEYVHDLSDPVGDDLKDRFELIYDGGTTEHVFDIAQSFRNVDAMLKERVSSSPASAPMAGMGTASIRSAPISRGATGMPRWVTTCWVAGRCRAKAPSAHPACPTRPSAAVAPRNASRCRSSCSTSCRRNTATGRRNR